LADGALTSAHRPPDLAGKNASFTNPQLTAATMAWATKILVV
jgi:hypothetical protein